MKCRHCRAEVEQCFLDLGFAPPSNAYLSAADLHKPERYYPLRLRVCNDCWLVQTEDYAEANELFGSEYAYFSSTSTSWLDHAARYAAGIIRRLGLGAKSFVVEVASNDGYLLKNFVAAGIPCLGIEPTASTARAAEAIGVPMLREFFTRALGEGLARDGRQADLIVANNVYAHVPDINDFTAGLKAALRRGGTITLEFPHLMRLIEHAQFDTVYHEHFSYLLLHTASRILARAGLRVHDVEELATHGGSLRVYACHDDDVRRATPAVAALLAEEERRSLRDPTVYRDFQQRADRIKDDLLLYLIGQKRAGKRLGAYSAAAKGSTLLNYAGIKPDLLPYVCDAAPSKQGKYLPGSHIPILAPQALAEHRPEIVLILAWNIADEIGARHADIRTWGGKFVVAVPSLRELS
ncbi:MAG TPA: class I SAM-dependent methyltransferase [Burkholderiales bacterium]|nr:class I SAM-dependent methyltransferase [Burkholderiales bacterium]